MGSSLHNIEGVQAYTLYNVFGTPVCAHGQLPLDNTQFDAEFPASLTSVSCGGVSHNAVKHFEPRMTEFPVSYQFQHALPVLL